MSPSATNAPRAARRRSIFDLHLNRARNPADVEWSAYDFIALIQLTVDTIAVSSGLDGNLGAPRQAVVRAYAGVHQAQATLAGSGQQPVLMLVITSEQG